MTDPFKSPFKNDFEKSMSLPHTLSEYNKLPSPYSSSLSATSPTKSFSQSRTTNQDKQAFMQAHIDANRELIKQLKNNIELLFTATRYSICSRILTSMI
jgi:hypothetical protein